MSLKDLIKINKTVNTIICIVCMMVLQSLAQPLAAYKSKFVGNIIGNAYSIPSNFSKYWNQVTAENAGKWGSVEFSAGNYNWDQLDKIYNYALNRSFPYKHHCLIWGQQQPSFLDGLDSATQYQEVENWIKASGERYSESDFCDVVNEPLHAPPSYKQVLGGDGQTGWDWVIKAFELARQYWPNTRLLVNDYNIINSSSATDNYIEIINLLKERNLVDGIGIQGHNYEVNTSPSILKSNLDKLAKTGLPIYISEFDINESDDNTQLNRYKSVFPVLYQHPDVHGITIWGYIQYQIWQTDAYLLTDRNAERPAMEWLRNYLVSPFSPVIISPNGTSDELLDPVLLWHASDSAKTYTVQISNDRNFSSIILDSTVTDTLFQTDLLSVQTRYYWRVNASNERGTSEYSALATFMTGGQVNDINDFTEKPTVFELDQNYPNPFNPSTVISYQLPVKRKVKLIVYDVLGHEVAVLVNEEQSAGFYRLTFNAGNLANGIYFYILRAGDYTEVKRMLLVK